MGWLYSSGWPTASAVRDHLREQLTAGGSVIKKDALVAYGHRYYAAVTNAKDGKTSVFCALINGDKRDGYPSYGYKDMNEFMGPCDVDCPLSVLDAADPLDSREAWGYGPEPAPRPSGNVQGDGFTWATEWRKRVRAYWAAKATSRAAAKTLKSGDRVWIRNAAGNPFKVYTYTSGTGSVRLYDANGRGPYRVPVTRIERVEATTS